ncbi:hypothetical protein NEMBOFW57_001722 [Staphylotrichum longicolle]|uniref:Uncharacterized protein n=1 Tax=Staphylotrichum longicolle TaxID=669026 RepID=A0AAD4F1Q5_9PEZI|nr:hypothetical protein NEMBOFW57_001722 [Staphylotrichum longicolle]
MTGAMSPRLPGAHQLEPMIGAIADFPSRPPSISSKTSGSSSRSYGFQNPEVLTDLYRQNPYLPSSDQKISVDYEPWSLETDERISLLAKAISVPPRGGMLSTVDSDHLLQHHMDYANSTVHGRWERLLHAYDMAMRGKVEALLALGAAHQRIREEQEVALMLKEKTASLGEENRYLVRNLEGLEKEGSTQQRRIKSLENVNRTLTREGVGLKAKYDKTVNAQETQLVILEEIVNDWETLTGTPRARVAPGATRSIEARFRSVRDALEEARTATSAAEARHRRLREQYDSLEKATEEAADRPQSAERLSTTQLELRVRDLERELETERARAADRKGKGPAESISPPIRHQQLPSGQQTAEVERLKKEATLYRVQIEALEEAIEELEQKLAEKTVRSAHEQQEYQSNMDDIETSVKDLAATVSGAVGGIQDDARPESSADNAAESLVPERLIREIEAVQDEALQSSKAIMDEIKARIAEMAKKVSAKMAGANALHIEQAQQILEELKNMKLATDTWARDHEIMEENQGLIREQLDALQQQVQSDHQAFQEIGEQVEQQRARVETVKTLSQQSTKSEPYSSSSRQLSIYHGFRELPSGGFRAEDHELEFLQRTIQFIEEFYQNSESYGEEAAAHRLIQQLTMAITELNSVEPETPAEDLMKSLRRFMIRSVREHNIVDNTDFYLALAQYSRHLRNLLELERFTPQQSQAERDLLDQIEKRIVNAAKLQDAQTQLIKECEAHRAQQGPRPLTSSQSEDLFRLCSSLLETMGGRWSGSTPTSQEGAAAINQLITKIQEMAPDPRQAEGRWRVQNGIKALKPRLVELEEDVCRIKAMADSAHARVDAFVKLNERGFGMKDEDMDPVYHASLKRRETRLRREEEYTQVRLTELSDAQAASEAFLVRDAAADRHRAEQLLTKTLFQIQASGVPGQHGGSSCFCTLLRFLFPRIYYSTVTGGCCASGKPPPPTSSPSHNPREVVASCQGHHGHGALASSSPLWTSLCRVFTALTWLLFLVLIQPYNLRATAAFLLSLLLGLPLYLCRLLTYHTRALVRSARRRRRRRHVDDDDDEPKPQLQTPLPPTTPRFEPLRIPPASTLVSSVVTLLLVYAWLAYVAVVAERRIWVGPNDWRYAYVLDVTSGRPLSYAAWSPARVDWRLVYDPAWDWFAGAVHSLFEWERGA